MDAVQRLLDETNEIEGNGAHARLWSQHLQRRIMRLLLLHGEALFRNQFRLFFVNSALPPIPLLQQYDRYMRLRTLSSELLDDILPRIRRQLSLKTSHARLHEETPTRGDVDWQRSIERTWNLAPGQPPLQFETRLRLRTLETPENLLAVAILLAYRRELQATMGDSFEDEELSTQEQQVLVRADEQATRELAAPYAQALQEQARKTDIAQLAQEVGTHMRPGPYRDLLSWWQRFTQFHIGRASEERVHALASKRVDEKTDAWLYELWIVLECIHLLQQEGAVQTRDMRIDTDLLQCTFRWQDRRFCLIYNRQLDTSTGFASDWEHGPASRPDYTIEREEPLEIRYNEQLIWREPPVVLDAKYYLGGSDPTKTHGPIKKLLGDMTLLGSQTGALFFPQLPEPMGEQQITRTIQRSGKQYSPDREWSQQIHLYRLAPDMPFADLQKRLRAVLDLAVQHLPERPAPVCMGSWLDPDNVNVSRQPLPPRTIICPKPHIGPGVFDLVNADSDCLKNPLLCHVIGQPIAPPFVVRVTTQEQLAQQSSNLRSRSDELLSIMERGDDEVRAEQLRDQIFTGIGRAVEQYVKVFGNTKGIEENFERWVFGPYWKQHPRCLSEEARQSLISGEYVRQNYQEVTLQDWAAPSIQYCRALEFEVSRRLYNPCPTRYQLKGPGFTLGTLVYAYALRLTKKEAKSNWETMLWVVSQSGSNTREFEELIKHMIEEKITEKRNLLAHGGAVTQDIAISLYEHIIGNRHRPGLLYWLAENLEPA